MTYLNALIIQRRMEEALSQPEINSPVAEQQVIENLLGKRVARRQGYRSRGPSSSSSGILISSEMRTLRQQLDDSLKAQEELRRQYEDSQKQMQDQATVQVHMQSQIQLLLSRVGMEVRATPKARDI